MAWRTVEPIMADMRPDGVWVYAGDFLPVAVETAVAVRRRPAADVLVEAATTAIAPLRAPGLDAALHLARGHLLAGVDHAAAAEHFQQARLVWQQIGRPYAAAQAAELHARTVRGLPDEAAAELAEALRTYTRLGAFADAARAQQFLHGPGISSAARPQGRRGYGNALSPRELQVARLLAAGSRNPDIAKSLVLSTRTVEHHVARVLKKLEVTDRTEVSSVLQDYEN
jgi:DNA-binding CsgD family transcriptional regulator